MLLRACGHRSAAVSSAYDGRRTMGVTVVVRAADGRRTMTTGQQNLKQTIVTANRFYKKHYTLIV